MLTVINEYIHLMEMIFRLWIFMQTHSRAVHYGKLHRLEHEIFWTLRSRNWI